MEFGHIVNYIGVINTLNGGSKCAHVPLHSAYPNLNTYNS